MIEVHISEIHKREAFRHRFYVSAHADGVISGLRTDGYTLRVRRLAKLLAANYGSDARLGRRIANDPLI